MSSFSAPSDLAAQVQAIRDKISQLQRQELALEVAFYCGTFMARPKTTEMMSQTVAKPPKSSQSSKTH